MGCQHAAFVGFRRFNVVCQGHGRSGRRTRGENDARHIPDRRIGQVVTGDQTNGRSYGFNIFRWLRRRSAEGAAQYLSGFETGKSFGYGAGFKDRNDDRRFRRRHTTGQGLYDLRKLWGIEPSECEDRVDVMILNQRGDIGQIDNAGGYVDARHVRARGRRITFPAARPSR